MRDAIQRGCLRGFTLALLLLPTPSPAAVFPCSLAGFDAALAAGDGPHALACTATDTITVPRERVLVVQGEVDLDLGGVTIGFEGVGRARLSFTPTVTCAPECVRGATTARIGSFTLLGGVSAVTPQTFDAPGSVDVAIHDAVIRPPANLFGGIQLAGFALGPVPDEPEDPDVSLHLIDSVLDGSHSGITAFGRSRITIERSLVTDTFHTALTVSQRASARIVNSTFSDNSPHRQTLVDAGPLDIESSTIVVPPSGTVGLGGALRITIGTQQITICRLESDTTVKSTLVRGTCGAVCASTQYTSLGGNVATDPDCNLLHPTDQLGVGEEALGLGPLTPGPGPTATHPLLPGSVAIDAGVDCAVPEDQRGVARPQGAACDAGAHELEAGLAVPIDVRPGISPNAIDPTAPDAIPVALLGSEAADVRDVLAAHLAFGPAEAPPLRTLCDTGDTGDTGSREEPAPGGDCAALFLEDVDGDGRTDLVSHYRADETGIAFGQDAACLTGRMRDGAPLRGCDAIATPPACGLGFEPALLLPPLAWWRRRNRATRRAVR